ncbi:unnamed protein product [Candida verbasci]|uniref:C2H2-type domain-containing protein n=1 Tax=Candida verbasci TaxID=1227364 RepID=A0A9W4TZ80_9ASCO|nr:unnamed protein product [Candida verbasci]
MINEIEDNLNNQTTDSSYNTHTSTPTTTASKVPILQSQSTPTNNATPSLSSQSSPPILQNFNQDNNKFIKNLFDNNVLTHGYVHGHIHKHKDHTHIHGHIHNHDHDHHFKNQQQSGQEQEQEQVQEQDLIPTDISCPDFENLALCKDVFCNDLDDCFFLNCDDSRILNCNNLDEICCNDKYCQEAENENLNKICDGVKTSADDSIICNNPNCDQPNDCYKEVVNSHLDKNNLCELQLSKKPIFENLINNVHQNVHQNLQYQNEEPIQEPPTKKIRYENNVLRSDFDLHFPHHCHPDDVKDSNNHHHFHQSCFHTTIPEKSNSTINFENINEEMMNDFDFVIHFNQMLNNNQNNTNVEVIDENKQNELPYSCQWEKCFKKVNDETLLNHVLNNHIENEITKNVSTYQCEWNDCNFMNNDLNLLINHLNTHKSQSTQQLPQQPNILTPLSTTTIKSTPASPINYQNNDLNITSMKILPKKRRPETEDLEFKCKWQIGVDSQNNPIPCNVKHANAGDLQNHLINDHIGSGKSIYNCRWIGCERHNGKFFTQRQKLFRHIHIHTNYKPCKCEICGSCFAVDSMLLQHLRTHSGEKPFKCQECGKSFATSSSLSIHKRVHTGEKPSICKYPGCGKRFSESSNLLKHEKIHEKNFRCQICNEIFEKKKELTKHMKSHKTNSSNNNGSNLNYNLLSI